MKVPELIRDIVEVGILRIENLFSDFEHKMLLWEIREQLMRYRYIMHVPDAYGQNHINSLFSSKDITYKEASELLDYNASLYKQLNP